VVIEVDSTSDECALFYLISDLVFIIFRDMEAMGVDDRCVGFALDLSSLTYAIFSLFKKPIGLKPKSLSILLRLLQLSNPVYIFLGRSLLLY
jgi:hypothetical protein